MSKSSITGNGVVPAGALVRPMLVCNVAANLAVVFDGCPDTDVDGREHCSFSDHCTTSLCSTPKRMNSGVWVMAVSRAAASRIAMTRISVGIRSRYLSPLATELSVMARPSAVAIAICAEVSAGSDAVSGLSRISSIDGNCRKSRRNAINSAAARGTMRFAAAALGWNIRLLDRVGSAAVAQLLGLDREADYAGAEREHPELVALVVREKSASDRGLCLSKELVSQVANSQWYGTANVLSPEAEVLWINIRCLKLPAHGDHGIVQFRHDRLHLAALDRCRQAVKPAGLRLRGKHGVAQAMAKPIGDIAVQVHQLAWGGDLLQSLIFAKRRRVHVKKRAVDRPASELISLCFAPLKQFGDNSGLLRMRPHGVGNDLPQPSRVGFS